MPSFAPAMRSVKNRSHSASVNVMPFSASSCVRRLATSVGLGRDRQVLVRLRLQELDELALQLGLGLVAVALGGSGTNSATTVLSALTAIGSIARSAVAPRSCGQLLEGQQPVAVVLVLLPAGVRARPEDRSTRSFTSASNLSRIATMRSCSSSGGTGIVDLREALAREALHLRPRDVLVLLAWNAARLQVVGDELRVRWR